ncbi:Hypothetical predicted protein, partial [Olea europaea subsp. europaea]
PVDQLPTARRGQKSSPADARQVRAERSALGGEAKEKCHFYGHGQGLVAGNKRTLEQRTFIGEQIHRGQQIRECRDRFGERARANNRHRDNAAGGKKARKLASDRPEGL